MRLCEIHLTELYSVSPFQSRRAFRRPWLRDSENSPYSRGPIVDQSDAKLALEDDRLLIRVEQQE